jgi:hypothetical protein
VRFARNISHRIAPHHITSHRITSHHVCAHSHFPHRACRPWAAPTHRTSPILASALQAAYGIISSVPTLLVVQSDGLELLSSGGVPWVRKDASASAFPWRGQSSPPPDFGSGNALLPMMAVSFHSCPCRRTRLGVTQLSGCHYWHCCHALSSLVSNTQFLRRRSQILSGGGLRRTFSRKRMKTLAEKNRLSSRFHSSRTYNIKT